MQPVGDNSIDRQDFAGHHQYFIHWETKTDKIRTPSFVIEIDLQG